MAIQFRCSHCSRPIEVDDVYAGQSAICPYCREEVSVPTESALEPGPANAGPAPSAGQEVPPPPIPTAPSAPGAPPPLPTVPPVHPVPQQRDNETRRAARRWANLALICAGLSVALFAALLIYQIVMLIPMAQQGKQPTPEQQMEMMKHPAFMFGSLAVLLAAVVGLVLAIVSLNQDRSGNWRAYVALAICGLFVLCNCSGSIIAALTGMGVPSG